MGSPPDHGPTAHLPGLIRAWPDLDWSAPSRIVETGVHDRYRQATLVKSGRYRTRDPVWLRVLGSFGPIHSAWCSWIGPGGFILRHRDAGPYRARWQYPILAGNFDGIEATAGVPFRVAHWVPHEVIPACTDRVHIVIDCDPIQNPARQPFEVIPHGVTTTDTDSRDREP